MADKIARNSYPMNNFEETMWLDCHVDTDKCGAANHSFERESVNSARCP